MDIREFKRIIIIGNNGSGKSYLSKQLSRILKLPLIHLDLAYWGQNWKPTPRKEWEKKQLEITSKDKWIIDGNHTSVLETRFQRTDLIIFLNINRITCLLRVLKRIGEKRTDMPSHLNN